MNASMTNVAQTPDASTSQRKVKLTEEERQKLKARVQRERGYWGPLQESLFRLDANWLNIYLGFISAPSERISHKLRHLIYIAVDASVMHLYHKGIALHMELALKAGATQEEIFAVLQLLMEMGALTFKSGLPILMDELKQLGRAEERAPIDLTPEQLLAKSRFTEQVGHWPVWLDQLMRVSPAMAEGMLALVAAPWADDVLDKKTMALIMVAAYGAPTTVQESSLREFIRLALKHGACGAEIAEVLQLASGIAMHPLAVAAPMLVKLVEGEEPSTYTVGP